MLTDLLWALSAVIYENSGLLTSVSNMLFSAFVLSRLKSGACLYLFILHQYQHTTTEQL